MSLARTILLTAALIGLTPAALVLNTPVIVAQTSVESLLNGMPRPKETSTKVSAIFAANAYQQKAINYQAKMEPEQALKFFQHINIVEQDPIPGNINEISRFPTKKRIAHDLLLILCKENDRLWIG